MTRTRKVENLLNSWSDKPGDSEIAKLKRYEECYDLEFLKTSNVPGVATHELSINAGSKCASVVVD